jgi:uncharacterized coiled-coil DUF342 family protein
VADVPTIDWPEGMDERMRALVSLDIQRNAILLSAIESSMQTVREDVRVAQQANMRMFNTLRDDFTDLRTEVRDGFKRVYTNMDGLRLEVHDLRTEVNGLRIEISEVRTEMHDQIGGLRTEISEVRTEMHEEITGLRTEMHDQITGLRTEMRDEITGLRTEMRDEIGGVRGEIGSLRTEMHEKFDLILSKLN